jgi:hypothetical protein
MKKLSYLLLLLFSLSFISCSSDDNSTDDNLGGENPIGENPINENPDDTLYIKFTVNGETYNFEPTTLGSLQKHIMGVDDFNDVEVRISLWMPVNPTLGSHAITTDFSDLDTAYNAEVWLGDDTIEGTSGTLTITEIDEEYIEGTFNFSGTNENEQTIHITNGSFRAYN